MGVNVFGWLVKTTSFVSFGMGVGVNGGKYKGLVGQNSPPLEGGVGVG